MPAGAGTFRWVNRVMSALFAVAAVLQYNDPDPWRWVAVYGFAALACASVRFRSLRFLPWLLGAVCLVWAARLAPSVLPHLDVRDLFRAMKAEQPVVESGRELLGLMVVAGWMICLSVISVMPAADGRTRPRRRPAP